jgi:H+/Cl- antiporter ClcA
MGGIRFVTMTNGTTTPSETPNPTDLIKDRSYLVLLVFGAVIGIPVAAVAYFILKTMVSGQQFFFDDLPRHLGFRGEPLWWPLIPLAVGGLLAGAAIRYLPGKGGHSPADGFKASGGFRPIDLPGILLAALASLCFGVVLGPEAPLIAIGGGLGALVVHVVKRDAPQRAALLVGSAGSFAAISVLFGSPLAGAFLLMEAAGLGAGMVSVLLMPGLLAAGVGALIFTGLDNWTGFGTFSLAISPIPHSKTPDAPEFLWAIGIGLAAAIVGVGIRRLGLLLRPIIEKRMLLLMPVLGLGIAGLGIAFAQGSGKSSSEVFFSGQTALPSLVQHAGTWSLGALVLLLVCKGLGYGMSLSAFRGGPTFPGMFIGAAGGIALSHGPGLPMIAGVAMGIGAMTVAMLSLPLTAVLITSLLLQADATNLIPLVIVAVVVSYVVSTRLAPAARPSASTGADPATGPADQHSAATAGDDRHVEGGLIQSSPGP